MATKMLLLDDVEALGRQGQIVSVKPGFARNFLVPKKLAVVADANALRRQSKLEEERAKRAEIDLKESNQIAERLAAVTLTTEVKVDQEGHMYGSVTVNDLLEMLSSQHKVELGKRDIQLKHPIKKLGDHEISVKLKEGVEASFKLTITAEGVVTHIEESPEPKA